MLQSIRGRFREGDVVNVLGVRVDPTNMDEAVGRVIAWAREVGNTCRYVCVSGMHGVVEAQSDEELRHVLNRSDLNVPDGMPLSWLGWFAGFASMGRVYGPDLMERVCDESRTRGIAHFLYGGNTGVAEHLAECLKARYPGLLVAGTYCPPFRVLTGDERDQVQRMINESGAQIVWVGLSTPKQERWMAEMRAGLHAAVVLGVGAAFDYNTGRLRRAPRWMQRGGMEWTYRILQEPVRLFRRYSRSVPRFLCLLVWQATGRGDVKLLNGRIPQ